MAEEDRTVNSLAQRSLRCIRFRFGFFILRNNRPHILGLVTNDTCKLNCIDCRVANIINETMRMNEIDALLDRFIDQGVRMLYLT